MALTNAYATLAQVKAAARISDSVDDSLLEMATESASRIVDTYCNRRFFTNGTETRVYSTQDFYTVDVDDIAGTAITVKTSTAFDGTYDVTWSASDWQGEPLNRWDVGHAAPITRLRAVGSYLFTPYTATLGRLATIPTTYASTQVTAVFGYGTAVPTEVAHATILLALRQYSRYGSPTGVQSGEYGPVYVTRKLDPDVAAVLANFRRSPVGVA